jgi:hypothetical protein
MSKLTSWTRGRITVLGLTLATIALAAPKKW